MLIAGNYHDGKTSKCHSAHLEVLFDKDEAIRITFASDDEDSSSDTNETISEHKISDIKGVGPKMVEKLQDAGFTSLQSIIDATPDALAEVKGISVKKAKDTITAAKPHLSITHFITSPKMIVLQTIVF